MPLFLAVGPQSSSYSLPRVGRIGKGIGSGTRDCQQKEHEGQ